MLTLVTLWIIAHQATVCGISQARILEWIVISSPGDLPDPGIIEPTEKPPFFFTDVHVACSFASGRSDSAILRTLALQAPLFLGFSRQEY